MSYTIIKDPKLTPFHISRDQYCYTVVETITPDNGKDYEKPIGHYGNLGKALQSIATNKMRLKQEYSTVRSYINEWEEVKDKIDQLLNKLNL